MGLCKSVLFLLLFGYFLQSCCSKRSNNIQASYGGIRINLERTQFAPLDQDLDLDNDERNVNNYKQTKPSIPIKKPKVTDVGLDKKLPRVFVVNLSKEKIKKLKKALRKKKFGNVHVREDPCKYDPCLHRGFCRNDLSRGPSKFICICPVGYYGARCQNAVPICGDDPCENGECLSKLDRSLCRCFNNHKEYICNTAPTGRRSTIFTKLSGPGVKSGHVTHNVKRGISISLVVLIALASLLCLCCLIHCFRVWSRRKDLKFFHEESIKDGIAEEPPPPGCTALCGQICLETLTGQKQTQEYSKRYGVDIPPLTQNQMNEIIKLVEPHTHQEPDKKASKPAITKPPKSSISKDLVKEPLNINTSKTSKKSLVSSKKSLVPMDIMDSCRAISQAAAHHSSNLAFVSPGAERILSKLLPKERFLSYLKSIEQLPSSAKRNKGYYEQDTFAVDESLIELSEVQYRKPLPTSHRKPIKRFVRYHEPDTSAMEERITELSEVQYRKPLPTSRRKPIKRYVRYHEPDSSAVLSEAQYTKPFSASLKRPKTRNERYYEKEFTEISDTESRKHLLYVSDTSAFEGGSTEKSDFDSTCIDLLSSGTSALTGASTEISDFDRTDPYILSSGASALTGVSTEKSDMESINHSSFGSGTSAFEGSMNLLPYASGTSVFEASSTAISEVDNRKHLPLASGTSGDTEISEMRRKKHSQYSAIGSDDSTQMAEVSSRPSFSAGSDMSAGSTQMSDVNSWQSLSAGSAIGSAESTQMSGVSSRPSFSAGSGMSAGSTQMSDISSKSLSAGSGMSVGSTQMSDVSSRQSLSAGSGMSVGSTQMSDVSSRQSSSAGSGLSAESTQMADVSSRQSSSAGSGLSAESTQMSDVSSRQSLSAGSGLSAGSTQMSDVSSRQSSSARSGMSTGSTQMSDVNSRQGSSVGSGMSAGSTQMSDMSSRQSSSARSDMSAGSTQISEVSSKQSSSSGSSFGMSAGSTDKSVSSSSSKDHRKRKERNYESGKSEAESMKLRTRFDKYHVRGTSSTEKLGDVRRLSDHEIEGNNSSSSATPSIYIKQKVSRDDIHPVQLSTQKNQKVTFRSSEDQHTKPTKNASEEKIQMKAVSPVRGGQLKPPVTNVNIKSINLSKSKHGDDEHDPDQSKMALKALSSGSSRSTFLTTNSSVESGYKGASMKETTTGNRSRKRSTGDDEGGLAGRIRPVSSPMYPKTTLKQIRTIIKPVSSKVYEDWSFSKITATPTGTTNISPEKYQKYFDNEAKRTSQTRFDRSRNCQDELPSILGNRGITRVSKRKSSRYNTRGGDGVFSNITNNCRLSVSKSPSEVNINPNNSQLDYIAFQRKSCDFEAHISNDSEGSEKHDNKEFNVDKSSFDSDRKHHEYQDEPSMAPVLKAKEDCPDAPEDESHESQPCSPQKHDNSDQLVPNLSIASEDRSTPEPQTLDSRTTNTSENNHLALTPVEDYMPKDLVDLESSFENLDTLEAIPEDITALEDSQKITCREDETLNTSWLVPKSPIVHVETENLPDATVNMSPEKCSSESMDVKDISVTLDDLQNALGQTVENLNHDDPGDELEGDELKNLELNIITASPESVASISYQTGKDISLDEAECDKTEHVDDASLVERAVGLSYGDADVDNDDLNESLEWPDIENTDDRQCDSVKATFGSITVKINELSCELEDVEDQEITFRL